MARADGRRPARRRRAAAVLDRRRLRPAARARWLDPALAARIPFALLLALALALTWYAAYHLARSESAQPLPFAFGGEAEPIDYARAIADGALLALIASLGLLQLGHETTPELVQLVARRPLPLRPRRERRITPVQGAPVAALALVGARGERRAEHRHAARRRRRALALSIGARAGVARASPGSPLGALARRRRRDRARRLGEPARRLTAAGAGCSAWLRQIAWFAWPAWLLACGRSGDGAAGCRAGTSSCRSPCARDAARGLGGDGRQRPRPDARRCRPLAVLAAFALPTLQRSAAAAIDWFSVFFFTIAVATGWVFYVAMQTGMPAKLAANVAKLSPGYAHDFSLLALALALAGTLAWLWLVRWRTGRSRHPLWKSLVLPAGGVSVCWLLVMTLLLPPLDNARSYRSMVQRDRAAGAGRRLHRRAGDGARRRSSRSSTSAAIASMR